MLLIVTAPHFCAAAEIRDGRVVYAAPILNYMMGWTADQAKAYAAKKGWAVVEQEVRQR